MLILTILRADQPDPGFTSVLLAQLRAALPSSTRDGPHGGNCLELTGAEWPASVLRCQRVLTSCLWGEDPGACRELRNLLPTRKIGMWTWFHLLPESESSPLAISPKQSSTD